MDWADDVAYSVHDLEDGFVAGLITFKNLNSLTERTVVSQTTATTYVGEDVSVAELTEVLDALLALDVWPTSYDGGPETAAALKNATSELIGRFCISAQDATLAAHPRPLARCGSHRAAPAAAGMRPAQGDHRALRDDPRRGDRGPGPRT